MEASDLPGGELHEKRQESNCSTAEADAEVEAGQLHVAGGEGYSQVDGTGPPTL